VIFKGIGPLFYLLREKRKLVGILWVIRFMEYAGVAGGRLFG
jgi:hypothetical protein